MRGRALVTVILVAVLTSCGLSRTSTPVADFPVTGVVTAGPTCPVQQDPPDPACADRPVGGATLHILDAKGDVYGEDTVGPDGRFAIRLPAGKYVLEPQPVEGLLGTAQSVSFEVGPGLVVDLTIQYDTGIR